MNTSTIISDLEHQIEKVDTTSLDISFNELLDMYLSNELNITPEYQRLFRWTEGARSRFIESLLLQMPVPPIYVIETDEAKYELIDGLQRFSSYLHLRGHLIAEHMGVNEGDKLVLNECDIVESLNGLTFENLPTILQIKLKRAFIRVEVVKKTSDKKFKYHMFKRLNTGGESLSEQQIRNCTIRLLDAKFNDFIIKLSQFPSFATCIENISEKQKLEAFDQELVLRFFSLKNYRDNFVHDLADFMTEYMEKISSEELNFDYPENENVFNKTFTILANSWENKVFGRLNKSKLDLQSNFGIYHFESLSIGIQSILSKVDENNPSHIEKIKNAIWEIKNNVEFQTQTTGGGKNSSGLLKSRIELVETVFQNLTF